MNPEARNLLICYEQSLKAFLASGQEKVDIKSVLEVLGKIHRDRPPLPTPKTLRYRLIDDQEEGIVYINPKELRDLGYEEV